MSPARGQVAGLDAGALLEYARDAREAYVDFVTRLVSVESPTHDAGAQAPVQNLLRGALEDLGYRVRRVGGRTTGGHLYASPRERPRGRPGQLLVGHTDTVWPLGTLARLPVRMEDGCLYGPGTVDMKGGLAVMVFALRALRDLGLTPPATPVVFVNSDEETGSGESEPYVRRLARRVGRALILEPGLGHEGRLKTARKAAGRFDVSLTGRASHAGLAPEEGVSAVHELAHVILDLVALNDPERGTTVNVGVVEGGTKPNVVAASARAAVDVRVATREDGERLVRAIGAIRPRLPGVRLELEGGIRGAPLERTPRNRRLWELARSVGAELGMRLEEAAVGGGSDGNTTSVFTATLDGLGAVGGGPHADHEHIVVDATLDRIALLAGLLMSPVET